MPVKPSHKFGNFPPHSMDGKVIRIDGVLYVCLPDIELFKRLEAERQRRMASNAMEYKEYCAGRMDVIMELIEMSREVYDE